ncbi:MAG: hypothetical protein KJT03_21700, partial [Verrucomicrobiae bacterium]|nr:hypothetical protein [Verrucomicrobiae bacterium]
MKAILTILLCFTTAASLSAVESYVPAKPLIVDETWRWSELEALIPYTVRDAVEAPDGTIWFGVVGGLIEFDGYTAKPHWLTEDGFEDRAVTSVIAASDGNVYALIRDHIVRLRQGKWESLLTTDYTGFGNNRADEARDGSIWFGVNAGLFRSVNGKVEPVSCELESITSLIVDQNNRLWVSSASEGCVLGYQLSAETGLPQGEPFRIEWQPEGYPSFAVLGEGLDGGVWIAANSATHAFQYVDGHKRNVLLQSWHELLDSKVEYIFERPEGELWIIARGELLIQNGGKWIKRNPNRYYSDIPFATLLDNEHLILGGRNDSVHQFDFSGERWKTYSNLSYQCQDVSGAWW